MSIQSQSALSLARLSIEKPVLTWLVILFCVLGGLYGFLNVGRLEDPSFTIKQAIIFTPYPGATAEEVELEVTEHLEIAIQQMGEVKEILSESSPACPRSMSRCSSRSAATRSPPSGPSCARVSATPRRACRRAPAPHCL